VLLIAEPGIGKSAFLAQLAKDHPEWLRYFIRRDQRTPLGDVGARSFLMRIGYQLAALHPDLFTQGQVQLSVEQRIGDVKDKGQVVGVEVKKILASPFYHKAVEIRQHVERNAGRIIGLKLDELVIETRQLDLSDLQYMALLDPARALFQRDPLAQIVVLVDALDEIPYHDVKDNILTGLTNCLELPKNVHLVLSSRQPDDALNVFCQKQAPTLRTLALTPENHQLQSDVETYARRLAARPDVAAEFVQFKMSSDAFVAQAINKADGNIGYLGAVERALDAALARPDSGDRSMVGALLELSQLPNELGALYGFFLRQIKAAVARTPIKLIDPDTGETQIKPFWPAVYSRILGILAVMLEPLTPDQLKDFGQIDADREWVLYALDDLRQFMDDVDGHYRLYHATVQDFLTAPSTKANPQATDLYQDSTLSHRRILHYYHQLVGDWSTAQWSQMDGYGWRHLLEHAEQADPKRPAPILFFICDAGFLEAKRRAMTSAVALEEDWTRSLQACRAAGDYVRFVRYGLQRARQFMEISPLQSTRVARTAARLAVRRASEAAVERLAAEMALISHANARICAELALLEELITAGVKSPTVERLIRKLDSALTALPAGEDRDRSLVDYVGALTRAWRPGWQQIGRTCLDEVKSLLPKVLLLALLARGYAEDGDRRTALQFLRDALERLAA
jgi:hypothetical protein